MTRHLFQTSHDAVSGGTGGKAEDAMPRITLLLGFAGVFILGALTALLIVMFLRMDDLAREIRVLGIQVQDQSAIMIREGLSNPRDRTMGPTNVSSEVQRNNLPDESSAGSDGDR